MAATTPGPLAPDVLDRDDVKRALAEHDFAAAFSLFKKWGGLSQNRIASACQLTPGKVSTIISGRHQVTSFDVICRIADGLRIPGRMLGLADRDWERQPDDPDPPKPSAARVPDDAPWRPTATVHLAADLTRSDLVMDRRAAARALAGAALTGAALLDSLEGWLQPAAAAEPAHRHGRLGQREVEELETTARAFRAWDHKFGGGLRRKAVVGQLNEVAGHLDEHQAPVIERRLFQVMAYLGGTAATMAWDSGLQKQAQSYYRLALRAAHAGGDAAFGANVLAGMARQMLYRDRPQDALELVHLAQKGAQRAAGPRIRAMLHTREAWAYAAMARGRRSGGPPQRQPTLWPMQRLATSRTGSRTSTMPSSPASPAGVSWTWPARIRRAMPLPPRTRSGRHSRRGAQRRAAATRWTWSGWPSVTS
jgi:transcriptional regulator with XRE-family HTH domain